jgi:hypothetical protein
MYRFELLVACFLLATLPFIVAIPWSNGEAMREMNGADEYNEMAEEPFNVQRREVCAGWGDSCVPDTKVRFARCCTGTRCDCGSTLLGANNKCVCKKESLFGRRK